MKILKRFRKIDMPWVLEVITERFSFFPIEAMTSRSVVYGGAIRDALAGLPLRGDLDIVASPQHYINVVKAIDASSFWCRDNFNPTPPATYRDRKGVLVEAKSPKAPPRSRSNYGKNVPLEEITRFVNVRGIELEIIRAMGNLPPEESVIAVPSNVDIICCGLVMDRSGDIYEILESAEDDCKKHLLRFNELVIETVDIPRLERRIAKLEKRGWKSEIEIKRIKKQQAKAKRRAKAAEKENPKKEKSPESLWPEGELNMDEQTRLMEKHTRFAKMYGMTNSGAKRQVVREIPVRWYEQSQGWYDKEIELRGEALQILIEVKDGNEGPVTKETFRKVERDIQKILAERDMLIELRNSYAPKVEQNVMADGSVRYRFSNTNKDAKDAARYAQQTEAETGRVIQGRVEKTDGENWWPERKREKKTGRFDFDVKEIAEGLEDAVEEGLHSMKERNKPMWVRLPPSPPRRAKKKKVAKKKGR